MESGEIAVQRAQGFVPATKTTGRDSRGQVYTDRVLDRTLNVKCRYSLS
jgi:hypothetical protein